MENKRNNYQTIEAVVMPKFADETREFNIRERENHQTTRMDTFYEKTSSFGKIAVKLPLFLVKEFSLARINSFLNIFVFGFVGLWSLLVLQDPKVSTFSKFFPVFIFILAFYKILSGVLQLMMVLNDTKKIQDDAVKGLKNVPHFIIKVYRTLTIKTVDINWLAWIIYIFGGLFILLTTFYANYIIPLIKVPIKLEGMDDPFSIYSIVRYTLVITFAFHLFYLFWVRARINAINRFYGYEIVNNLEVMEIKKNRHSAWRRGVLLTLIVVGFIFILFKKLISRHRSNG